MATIVRSDNKLKQTRLVDLIERVITPVLDMDFVNEVYSKNGQDFNDINDVLTVTHARNGFYDSNYAYKYNPLPNMVSISNHPLGYRKGLMLETDSGNAFLNSSTPKSQLVTLPLLIAREKRVARFRVFGEGSIVVKTSSGGTVLGSASNGQDYYKLITDSDIARGNKFYIEVVGQPDFVEVYANNSNQYVITRTPTTNIAEGSPASVVKLKEDLIPQLLPIGVGCIVFKAYYAEPIVDRTGFMRKSVAFLGSVNSGISISTEEVGDTAALIHKTEDSSKSSTILRGQADLLANKENMKVYAINFSPTGSQVCCNGVLISRIDNDAASKLDNIYIGNTNESPEWVVNDAVIIEQLAVFNEQLTEDELIAITVN